MSRKPPEISDSDQPLEGPDDDSADVEVDAFSAESTAGRENFDEEDEEEFTLDHLSEAYARVLIGDADTDEDDAINESDGIRSDFNGNAESEISGSLSDSEPTEVDDNAACPIAPASIIEAILFVGTPKDKKLTSRKIAAVLRDVSPQEVTKIVKQLNARYEAENAAYRIKIDDGSIKMVLDESLIEFQQEFFGRNKQVQLSQAAIDVMAVVAYNQPVTREQVDKMRVKPSGGILAQLVRRNLLLIEPTENHSDKQLRYATTDKFLDFFNLAEIADLPQSHEVSDIDEFVD